MQTLLGNVFVFSTINPLLFNGNPLIKLDGYFILSDAIGQRNLYARSAALLGETRRKVASLGGLATGRRGRAQWAMLTYAVAAFSTGSTSVLGDRDGRLLIPPASRPGCGPSWPGAGSVMFVTPLSGTGLLRFGGGGARGTGAECSARCSSLGTAAVFLLVHAPYRGGWFRWRSSVEDHYAVNGRLRAAC